MKGQWGKLVGYFLATLLVSSAITFGLPLLGGGSWLPDELTHEGQMIDQLFWGLLILSLVIFAIVAALVIYSLVHFRAAPGDMSDGEHIHGNAKMELVWVVIPSIIVTIVGVLSYVVLQDSEIGLYDKSARKDKGAATMVVDVHAFSFGWNFRYKDTSGKLLTAADVEPAGELVVPVNQVIRFDVLSCSGKERLGRIRHQVTRELQAGHKTEFSEIDPGICEREWDATTEADRKQAEEDAKMLYEIKQKRQDGDDLTTDEQTLFDQQPKYHGDDQFIDVNHAFWVPEARLKIDAVGGLPTYVQWRATRVTGPNDTYQVVCAELCGSGHNGMRTDMCVVDQGTFDWWLKLDAETRPDATCVTLRLFTCVEKKGDRDKLLATLSQLSKEQPEATCAEAEEKTAA